MKQALFIKASIKVAVFGGILYLAVLLGNHFEKNII